MSSKVEMKKVNREWFVQAPWGKIALISWGDPKGEPVFMVHGRQDSVVSFVPLLQYLPDHFHYVAMDLPGHGLSDPMPIGVHLLRIHQVSAVDYVMKDLGWKRFIWMSHSLGCDIGLFYHVVYPDRIKKFILLDPLPALMKSQIQGHEQYFNYFFGDYYVNYEKYNVDERVFSKKSAVEAVKQARQMNEEQAELILSRNLIKVGDDTYKLAWDRRLRNHATFHFTNEQYVEMYTYNLPPTLVLGADFIMQAMDDEMVKSTYELLLAMQKKAKHFKMKVLEGNHDLHFIKPQSIAKDVCDFLNDSSNVKSKL